MIADSEDDNKLKKITYNNLKGATGAAGSSINPRGVYNALTAYSVNDLVSYNGSSYICILATTGNLPTNPTYWTVALTPSSATASTLGSVEIATSAESIAGTNAGTAWPLVVLPSDIAANTQSWAFTYAADAWSNDTYVISLTPAMTVYTTWQRITWKANTINTGACTININGLGAKNIKTKSGADPINGLIAANEIVTTTYNGTNMILNKDNPVTQHVNTVIFTYDNTTATWTQVVAHWLGVIPDYITFQCMTDGNVSYWTYDGTNQACVYTASTNTGNSTTFCLRTVANATNNQTWQITAVTSSNFTISRTKFWTPLWTASMIAVLTKAY